MISSPFPGSIVTGDKNKNVYFITFAGSLYKSALNVGNLQTTPLYYGGCAIFGESTTETMSFVHAYSAVDGSDLWVNTPVQVSGSIDATPVISSDLVLYVSSSSGALYAFDISDINNPVPLWVQNVLNLPPGTFKKVVANILSNDGTQLYLFTQAGIYAVQLAGRSTNPTVAWSAMTNLDFTGTQPIYNDQMILTASNNTVYGFDTGVTPRQGQMSAAWSYHVGGSQVYQLMNIDCVLAYATDTTGTFYTLDMKAGNQVNTFNPGIAVANLANSLLYDGQHLISPGSGTITRYYLLQTEHFGPVYKQVWSQSINGAVFSTSPFVCDSVLYAISQQGVIYSINLQDGAVLDSQQLPAGFTVPFSSLMMVPIDLSSTGGIRFLLDGSNYFTTMKNLFIAAKNGSVNNGNNPPFPPTLENLVKAVNSAQFKAYVLMWDRSLLDVIQEQPGNFKDALATLFSEETARSMIGNVQTKYVLQGGNVRCYLEPYPKISLGSLTQGLLSPANLGFFSQHQKISIFCINGNKFALVSGMNLLPEYYDTPQHLLDSTDEYGKNTYHSYHDTAVLLQGPVVEQVEQEFDRRWAKSGTSSQNPSTSTYVKLAGWSIKHDFCLDAPAACKGTVAPAPFNDPTITSAPVPVKVLITNSDDVLHPIRQIREALVTAINNAGNYIYFENFTFSEISLVEAIARKLTSPGNTCSVILMLPHPSVGDDIQFPIIRATYSLLSIVCNNWTSITYNVVEHKYYIDPTGDAIAVRTITGTRTITPSAITTIQVVFKSSVYNSEVVYTVPGSNNPLTFEARYIVDMTIPDANSNSKLIVCSPARYFSTVQAGNSAAQLTGWSDNYRGIYIHSKLALFDDATAVIGSANFNGRSMLNDGELSVQINDLATVTAIRTQLFQHWNMQDSGTSGWTVQTWITNMLRFATSPAANTVGVLPLKYASLPSKFKRQFQRIAFDDFDINPGPLL